MSRSTVTIRKARRIKLGMYIAMLSSTTRQTAHSNFVEIDKKVAKRYRIWRANL